MIVRENLLSPHEHVVRIRPALRERERERERQRQTDRKTDREEISSDSSSRLTNNPLFTDLV